MGLHFYLTWALYGVREVESNTTINEVIKSISQF